MINANSLSAGLLHTDLNVYIDISPETSIDRINKGRTSTELYETLDNLRNVKGKYAEIIELLKNEEKVFTVTGDQTPENIANDIWNEISGRFLKD